MFSSSSPSRSRDPQPISMRFWLYLGAVVVGFSLMAIEDRNAPEKTVDAPEASSSASDSAATVKRPPSEPNKAPDVAPLRSVSAELSRHGPVLSAK